MTTSSPINAGGGAVVAVITSIIVVALATTLVLPGRQTPQVISSFFTGLSGALRSAMGR